MSRGGSAILVAAVAFLAPASVASPRPFSTGSGSAVIGAHGVRVEVLLTGGRLRIEGKGGWRLYESSAMEHVYGWAEASLLDDGQVDIVVWLARRDENRQGVVPHDSGWMSYPPGAWIDTHVAILAPVEGGGAVASRWVSSSLGDVDGAWIEESEVPEAPARLLLRHRMGEKRDLRRYAFRGFALDAIAVKLEHPVGDAGLATLPQLDLQAVGDVMVGRETGRLLARGHEEALAGVRPLLSAASFRLGNLESCFGGDASGNPALDLEADPARRDVLRFLGFDVLTLANNHCTPQAAAISRRLLTDVGIATIGIAPPGGSPLDDVRLLERNGVSVALVGLSMAPTTAEAVAAFTTEENRLRLRVARAIADFLLVTIHWGDEYRATPGNAQRKLAHWLIDSGVDGVLGHHPHVIGPVETIDEGFVAYSLGNFLFDQEGKVPGTGGATEEGLVLEVRLHETLGWGLREHRIRILDRHRVVLDGSAP